MTRSWSQGHESCYSSWTLLSRYRRFVFLCGVVHTPALSGSTWSPGAPNSCYEQPLRRGSLNLISLLANLDLLQLSCRLPVWHLETCLSIPHFSSPHRKRKNGNHVLVSQGTGRWNCYGLGNADSEGSEVQRCPLGLSVIRGSCKQSDALVSLIQKQMCEMCSYIFLMLLFTLPAFFFV